MKTLVVRVKLVHNQVRSQVEVDSQEVALYLAIKSQDKTQQLDMLGLGEVVHTMVHPTMASKILITPEEALERGEKEEETVPGSRGKKLSGFSRQGTS